MTDLGPRGAFPHQHGDPRSLRQRIDAQLRERIEEAVEMAGIHLLVELRRRTKRPAPREGSARDREEFATLAGDLLVHLEAAFTADLPEEVRAGFSEAGGADADLRSRALAGQVFLAKHLPDYWQRFEAYRAAHAEQRLAAAGPEGWIGRLFGS